MAKNKYYPEEVLVEKVQKGEYGWLDYVNHYSAEWQEEYTQYCLGNGLSICEESAEQLCSKCDAYAAAWAPKAKEIWEEKERFKPFTQYYRDTPEGKFNYRPEDF